MMIQLPQLPVEETLESRCCYTFQRFYKIFRGKEEADRIYMAIGLTAEEMGFSLVFIAKILVEYGLRAPREAFPRGFVDFVEGKSELDPWAAGAMTYAQNKLAKSWQVDKHVEEKIEMSSTASNEPVSRYSYH